MTTKLIPASSTPFDFTAEELRSFGAIHLSQSDTQPVAGICSGVLFSPRYVLTAGHCAAMAKAAHLPATNWVYKVGSRIDAPEESHHVEKMAGLLNVYDTTHILRIPNDLCITRLADNVIGSTLIPITVEPNIGDELVLVAYGPETEIHVPSDIDKCIRSKGTARVLDILPGMLILEETRGTELYQGDSGGAVIAGPGNDKHLVGLISFIATVESGADFRRANGLPDGGRIILAPSLATLLPSIQGLIQTIETDTSGETVLIPPEPSELSILPWIIGGAAVVAFGAWLALR